MCGVNGLFAYHPSAPALSREELLASRDAMANRGPDGDGAWYHPDGRVALAHRRLKIIDLSDAGAQPMVSQCGRYVISFNGEIYNYRQLAQTLSAAGVRLRTCSDTEVLLELFAHSGIGALAGLRGMYALAIWDNLEQRLLLARDPYGIKPLYYSDDGWTLRCASQVGALRAGGAVSDAREPAGLAGFLLTGSVPEPWTLWQDIRALPAGHHLWCTESGAGEAVLSPQAPVDAPGANDLSLAQVLEDSVAAHLTADVPVAVFLSAGIDSTVLAALAQRQLGGALTTLTVGFDEYRGDAQDEVPLAAEVAAALQTRHLEYRYTQHAFDADLPAIMAAMDQPSIDGVNTWIVAKACAEHGIKTALSGLGADEIFAGYPSFRDVPAWHRAVRPFAWVPGAGRLLRRLSQRWLVAAGHSPKAAGMLEYAGSLHGAWLLKRGLFMPWELAPIMGAELAREGLKRLNLMAALKATCAGAASPQLAVGALEQCWYLRNQLLRDADWAGMDHSVEIRVPFVDQPVVRYASARQFTKQDLLQVAGDALPQALRGRTKTGFSTPLGQWRGNRGTGWARNWAQELACQF